MKNKSIRISLRAKFVLIFAAILLLTITGIAVANRILLGRMYESDKRKALIRAYNTVNALSSADGEAELDKISSVDVISMFICDGEGEEVFSSVRDPQEMFFIFRDRRDGVHGRWDERPIRPDGAAEAPDSGEADSSAADGNAADGQDGGAPPERREPPQWPGDGERWGRDRQFSFAEHAREELNGEKYLIRSTGGEAQGSYFLQLIAALDNGNYLLLQTSMAPVGEAADTANELLVFIGVVALLVGMTIIFAATGAATRPLRQLTGIARDMSALNFSRKYEGRSRDEVGELGQSINIMSARLEENINQLRESNAKLEKDIELKDSVDRMRKEFIANASHELKTPIALIAGYAEGLKENIAAGPEDREFYCDVIMDEAAKMDKVIKQFLTVAELDAADVDRLEKTRFNFSELAENSARSFELLARKKNAVITADCGENLEITADMTAIEQAVNNYIVNAVNHVDEGGAIRVELREEDDRLRFSVYNSGAAIPDSGAELIWESFGKLDKARTRAYGGSGLGLAIVKKCVELHGGQVGFENKDGGVEFYFII